MKRTSLYAFVLAFALAMPVYSATVNGQREESDPALSWVGKLVDQSCKEKHIDHNCPVGPSTERFGLVIDGGIILPFDDASNQMTKEAVAKDGRKGNLEVSVVGARHAGLFKIESIETNK